MADIFGFDPKVAAAHIGIAILVGGIVSYFTDINWIAASFWVSASMFLNGSLAFYEDARPGGFENPDGTDTPDFAKGPGARKFWAISLAVTAGLFIAGAVAQTLI
jgi:hypothetical protein